MRSLSMQKPAASFGSTATIPRRTQDRAADPSIAAWRSWVTHCFSTLDAHLVALDAKTGRPIWNTRVANASAGYAMTVAPLVVKDKVIVGVAGGEFGIRGFIAAYDVRTGREAWRFNTIPGPGEPGHETWQGQADAWEH